jgi:hypothetical protein
MTNQHNSNKFNQQGQQQQKKEEDFKPTREWKKGLYEGEDAGKLEANLEKEIREAGLHCKFIDYKQAKANGGRSRAGWIIYTGLQGDREVVRRGTTVLAVKNDANYKKLKIDIEKRRMAMNRYNANKAKELNHQAKSLGGTSRIIEGFDQNG